MKFASNLLLKFVIVTVIVMSVLTFQGVHAPAALAATQCSGASCNNLDPTTTVGPHNVYCNKNAYLQEHKNYTFGWIENWWSEECNANWTIVNVNSGYFIGVAEAIGCSSGSGFTSSGAWKCNSGATTIVCSYFSEPGWNICGALDPYSEGNIPAGTTHWYTNMVRGDEPTISVAGVGCVVTCVTMTMQTGWH